MRAFEVKLPEALPCRMRRDGQLCGRPAKKAMVMPLRSDNGEPTDRWELLPECDDCRAEFMARMSAGDQS